LIAVIPLQRTKLTHGLMGVMSPQ